MKKIFAKVVCVILACITVLAGCKNPTSENTNIGIKELDCYLVENGNSPYTIVIPENYSVKENEAKNELVSLFYEATGITLPVKTDNQIEYTEESTIISLGKTNIADNLGIIPDYKMVENNGYIIKTIDKSIFMVGHTDYGTLYSVYEFLETEFDYDYYTVDSYSLTQLKDDVKVKVYDVTAKPDIKMLEANYDYVIYDDEVRNRLKMMTRDEIFLSINTQGSVHNTFHYFPLSKYGECDDYYKVDKTDICFTAHGNATSYQEMIDIATAEIIDELKNNLIGTTIIIGQQDINSTCACSACTDLTNRYGAASVKGVLFCSKVLDKIYQWFDTEEGRPYAREFFFLLLAYEQFIIPPDLSLVDFEINDHFGVYLALQTDFTKTKEQIEDQYAVYSAWKGIAKKSSLYTYDMLTTNYLLPFDNFASKRSLYNELHNLEYISVFDQGYRSPGLHTCWTMAKVYLISKLRWDSSLNVNELLEKYFYGVYGIVGEEMLEIFLSFRAHWQVLESKIETGELPVVINDVNATLNKPNIWPLNTVKGWLNQYDKILDKIESLRTTDEIEFNRLNKMIRVERVSPLYMLIELHSGYFSEEQLMKYKVEFKEDVSFSGITVVKGTQSIAELLSGWGI